MTAHDPHLARKSHGLLRWLGFRDAEPPPVQSAPESAQESQENSSLDDRRERRRRELLEDICSFLLTHRLQVNADTLTIAFDLMTGAKAKVAQLIEERVQNRQVITTDWLEEVARHNGHDDGSEAFEKLVGQLETSMRQFSQTTEDARSATTEYNSALEEHVGEIERVGDASSVITELATIAKVMLERTREIEHKISVSEKETKALQKNLEDARREAEEDHLTGLPNRRAFEAVLRTEHEKATINGEPLCVAFCDLDHFKRINDTHGHDAGDRVLRSAAQSLSKISNDHCHVARHGGEEFVILFRGKTLDEAHQILDEAREALSTRRMVNRKTDQPFGKITFSAGIADVFDYANPREALSAADDALYAAKNSGRNKVLKAADMVGQKAA